MNGTVTFRADPPDQAPTFGLKMAPGWRVVGPGATFGLKMALGWRVAGPGAAFGLKMALGWRVEAGCDPEMAPV